MSLLDQFGKKVWENLDKAASNVLWSLWTSFKLEALKAMVSTNHEVWTNVLEGKPELEGKSKTIFKNIITHVEDLKQWWTDKDFLNWVIDSWLFQICKEAWSFDVNKSLLDVLANMINDIVNSKRNDAMNPNQVSWWAIVEIWWRPQVKYIWGEERNSYDLTSNINFIRWCAEQLTMNQWYVIKDVVNTPSPSADHVVSALKANPTITDLTQLPQAA